jgi:palmitoyl transferase
MMNAAGRALAVLLMLGAAPSAFAACDWNAWEWVEKSCRKLVDTYDNGGNELLISGYSWHTPWTWTAEKRAEENSNAWGLGWGRTVEKENGDTDSVYFLVFSDSHRKPEYNLGYAWSTYWGDRNMVQPGLGYTLMMMARSDIANGIPFPVVLPLFSLRFQKFTLVSTYIPNFGGGINHGSVLYAFGRVMLN